MSEKMRFKRLKSYIASLTWIWNDGVEERAETRQYKIIGQITDNIDGRQLAREVGWIGHDFDNVRFALQVQYENHQTWLDLESSSTDWYAQRTDESYKAEIKALNNQIGELQQGKQKLRKDLQDELISKSEDQDKFAKEREALAQQLKSQADTIADLKSRLAAQEWAGAEIGERTEARVRTLTLEKGQLNDLVKQLQSQIDVLKDVIQDKMS